MVECVGTGGWVGHAVSSHFADASVYLSCFAIDLLVLVPGEPIGIDHLEVDRAADSVKTDNAPSAHEVMTAPSTLATATEDFARRPSEAAE